ncbi:MAG: flagellar basal body rod protein FlgC [Planctomycetota bacterium]
MFGSLDISASGLEAQRIRLNTVAANIANSHSVTQDGVTNSPFRRRIALLSEGNGQGGAGVHVKEIALDQSPFRETYAPNHPLADQETGILLRPNIESINEQVNAMEASRAYEANITAAEATKRMMANALTLLS